MVDKETLLIAVAATAVVTAVMTWVMTYFIMKAKVDAEKSMRAFMTTKMTAETEKILRDRQEELDKRAKETFGHIQEGLGQDIKAMKESFEANKQSQAQTSASLNTKIEEAVRNLKEQTESIGNKADHLASALRGQNKMQGCWGETILNNILIKEGLKEGRDYDKEETLRDTMGIVVLNEDSGKKMRPDFILHYPDNTDIIVDSKVSLSALADWYDADTEVDKADAAARNLQAIKDQVSNLSGKRYWDNIRNGRKTLDYVVMFIPNYAAFQLAKMIDEDIFMEAYRQNVLITTEETIMPFLRMIRSVWRSAEQVRNQEKIIEAAQRMVNRVGELCEANAQVGEMLENALKAHERCTRKLENGGQSIVKAANDVVKFGSIEPKKPLPRSEDVYLE